MYTTVSHPVDARVAGGRGGVYQHSERRWFVLRQFVTCRVRHADVLEWLWFLSSHRKPIFDWMWGDKDTYRLAFALAGKVDNFQLVCIQTLFPFALCSYLKHCQLVVAVCLC